MKPLKLTMRAFGPYPDEQVLDFRILGARSCFLVHGPTGAGKTTILDAICFALYGESSGGEREARRMRSDLATPEAPTEVVFDFSIGQEVYRAFRSPEQERPKARGAGTTTQGPKATLWRRTEVIGTAREGEVVANQPRLVTAAVERILGFKREQFTQVVLLPQGKFRDLLAADSRRREEILEILFQTEAYRRIEELLKNNAAGAKAALEQANNAVTFLLAEAEVENAVALAARREAEGSRLAAIQSELLRARADKTQADKALQAAMDVVAKVQERVNAERELGELERGVAAVDEKKARLDRARRAESVSEIAATLHVRRQEQLDAETRRHQLGEELAVAEGQSAQAEEALGQERGRDPEREAARKELARLESLRGSSAALTEAVETRLALLVALREQHEASKTAASTHDQAESDAERLRATVEELRAVALQFEARQTTLKAAERSVQQLEKADRARKQLSAARTAVTRARAAKNQCEASLRKVVALQKAAQERWVSSQAGVLAAQLHDGEACPVCGSVDHPRPAVVGRRLVTRDELDRANAKVDEERRNLLAAEKELSSAESRVTALSAAIEAIGGGERANARSATKALADAQARFSACEAARNQLQETRTELKKARTLAAAEAKARIAAEREVQRLDRERAKVDGTIQELERTIPAPLRQAKALEKALAATRTKLKVLESALEKAVKRAQDAARTKASAGRAAAEADRTLAAAFRKARETRERFERARSKAGFGSDADFRAAVMDPGQIEELAADIERFQARLAAALARVARAREAVPSTEVPDLTPHRERVAALAEVIEAKSREKGESEGRLALISRWEQRLAELLKALKTAEERFGTLGRVSEVVNGRNSLGVTLQRFVLGALLDEVLLAATVRLRSMTRRRFDLERERNRQDARRAGGLDLVVLDAYTGTSRPVNTLSGGEGFLASLALALGLADVVQSYAGGIRLETIFVDEGFGSLDDEAMDLALGTLLQLQEGGRLVGIISHVAELRNRVDARLEVTASATGSRARFVV
jgi:exonuclease SbcC